LSGGQAQRNFVLMVLVAVALSSRLARGGPETAMREFASSQVQKGMRVLGMGGDGATQGNYSLIYRDAGGALVDYGITYFADTGNTFHFVAAGVTTPTFWHGAAFYLVVMDEWASGLHLRLQSPAFLSGADLVGEGSDQVVSAKFSKPLPRGFAIGITVGWERSALVAVDPAGGGSVTYTTTYLPSAGIGLTWEATRWLLAGVRLRMTNDWETRRDTVSVTHGWLGNLEVRAGVSVRPWKGAILDLGYVGLWRVSEIANTRTFAHAVVAGYEQTLARDHLQLRVGWNESAPTGGFSIKVRPFKLDVVYVYQLSVDRTAGVFGTQDHSVMATLNLDYLWRSRAAAP
jgi:hypothetical protein